MAIKFKIGVKGLWMGFSVGQVFVTLMYGLAYLRTDWQALFIMNRERKIESAIANGKLLHKKNNSTQ